MELKRGKSSIRAPKIGLLDAAHFVLHNNAQSIVLVRLREVQAKRNDPKTKDVVGLPFMMAHDDANDLFEFWPAPDFDLTVKVRFYPPMIEV